MHIYCDIHKNSKLEIFNFLPPVLEKIVKEYQGTYILYENYVSPLNILTPEERFFEFVWEEFNPL
jgi:hypothetical protein